MMKWVIGLLSVAALCSANVMHKRAAGDQNPKVFSALAQLSNDKSKMDAGQMFDVYQSAKAGQDFPNLAVIPAAGVECGSVKPGFYANDGAGKCQAFDRCDVNGNLTSYLCPNMTLFNQITLVCDWFWNVDCSKVRQFYDYSNSRLYQANSPLLDDEPDFVVEHTGASASGSASSGSRTVTVTKTVTNIKKQAVPPKPKRDFEENIEEHAEEGDHQIEKRAAGDQNPKVFSALAQLSNDKSKMDAGQMFDVYQNAKAGQDFPTLSAIPAAGVDCASVKPGFYANDGAGKCQAFDRCDVNGNQTSYLCPNMTLFNQITLVCDWFWNVDCSKVRQFYDYSNSRLYQENSPLLDDEPDFVVEHTGAAASGSASSGSRTVTVTKTVTNIKKGAQPQKPKRDFEEHIEEEHVEEGEHQIEKRAAGDQNPKVFSALAILSNDKSKMDAGQAFDVYKNAQAGQDYPTLSAIPEANVQCGSVKPGFYANDGAGKCQAFDRCDINGNQTSYLCPNMTLFNQITLVCDWFWNVDCSKARQFYDYSNSRLYQDGQPLLDDETDFVLVTGASSSSSASASGSVTIKKTVSQPKPKKG